MKAMSATQLLISILVVCALTFGLAVLGFWQYRSLSQARLPAEVNAELLNNAQINAIPTP